MPIITSRGAEIRRLLQDLSDPKKRTGAVIRLRSMGSRVVPHAADELARLGIEARHALLDVLRGVETTDAKAIKRRLVRVEPWSAADAGGSMSRRRPSSSESEGGAAPSADAKALNDLRTLPPPRANERASVSRERGEAHLALARTRSRLARTDLLLSLSTLPAERTRVYCEAAGLIGDIAFLAPLARIAPVRSEATKALTDISARERITARSKALRDLDEPLRLIVIQALIGQ